MFHLTDNDFNSVYDKHWHFGEGNMPVKEIIKLLPENSCITIETYKDRKDSLEDFERDVEYIRGRFE